MTIDPAARYQTLVGFGASLAYADDVIVARSDKDALYDLLFADSGLDALRLRNRYDDVMNRNGVLDRCSRRARSWPRPRTAWAAPRSCS